MPAVLVEMVTSKSERSKPLPRAPIRPRRATVGMRSRSPRSSQRHAAPRSAAMHANARLRSAIDSPASASLGADDWSLASSHSSAAPEPIEAPEEMTGAAGRLAGPPTGDALFASAEGMSLVQWNKRSRSHKALWRRPARSRGANDGGRPDALATTIPQGTKILASTLRA